MSPVEMETSQTTNQKIIEIHSKNENKLEDQTGYLPTVKAAFAIAGLGTAVFLSILDQTIVSTALTSISSDLKGGKLSSWLATSFLLTSTALAPIYGKWSDVFGRKSILIFALIVFWISSLACAVSTSMIQLIVFRAFQGIGASAIAPCVMIIISDIVSLKDRGKYSGIIEIIVTIATGVGPLLGGLFAGINWRLCFWINLPLVFISVITLICFVPLKGTTGSLQEKIMRIDHIGSLLIFTSTLLLLLGLNWGGIEYSWVSTPVLATLILSFLFYVSFFLWELKMPKHPIISMMQFQNITVIGISIITAAIGISYFVILYYVARFLQVAFAYSAIKSGIIMLAYLVPSPIVIWISGQLTAKYCILRPFIRVGSILCTISYGLLTTINEHTSEAKIVGYLVIGGVGLGFMLQTSVVSLQASVSRSEMASVTSLRVFIRLLFGTIGITIASLIINHFITNIKMPKELMEEVLIDPTIIHTDDSIFSYDAENLKETIIAAYVKGFRNTMRLCLACSCCGLLSSIFLVADHSLSRDDDDVIKAETRTWLKNKKGISPL